MSSEYSAVAAKLRAMRSRFLTKEDYEELLEKKSVTEVCAYLKNTAGYNDTLGEVNEREMHRGVMELLLEQDMMDEYIRLYDFMDKDKRDYLKFWFERQEIKFLKREMRYIYTHDTRSSDEVNQDRFDAFFETHTKINRNLMASATSIDDVIAACKDTPYADVLIRAQNLESDFFSVGTLLDSHYYTSLWRTVKKKLKGDGLKLMESLIGSKIDMLNLMWIYRGKKYYDFDNEIIFTYLLPIGYRLRTEDIGALVMTDSAGKFVDMVREKTKYGELFDGDMGEIFPEENYRRMYDRLSRNIFVNNTQSIAAIYAYLNLKEMEISNITTITEGIRYGHDKEQIRKHIGI